MGTFVNAWNTRQDTARADIVVGRWGPDALFLFRKD
jgi:hypothetical protein